MRRAAPSTMPTCLPMNRPATIPNGPLALKVFLTTLAIVDDLGAIVIIAVFYTGNLSFEAMAAAGVCIVALATLNLAGVRRIGPYMLIGAVLWVSVLKSGVHATLADVVTGPLGDRELVFEQPVHRRRESRVGEHQRQNRRGQQRQRRRRLAVDEGFQPVGAHELIPKQQNARAFRPGRLDEKSDPDYSRSWPRKLMRNWNRFTKSR
jgi:hypothetical protein